mgnify:FL=1
MTHEISDVRIDVNFVRAKMAASFETMNNEKQICSELPMFTDDEIHSNLTEIALLVTKSRLQAKEVEIRAKYAAEFAERAISEAQSAHNVAETLSKTSRIVAALALEFSNKADLCLEALWPETDDESRYESFLSSDSFLQSTDHDTTGTSVEDLSLTTVSPFGKTPVYAPVGEEHLDGNVTDSMRSVSEGAITRELLVQKMKLLEMKRKMILYKDSKVINKIKTALECGDSVDGAEKKQTVEDTSTASTGDGSRPKEEQQDTPKEDLPVDQEGQSLLEKL